MLLIATNLSNPCPVCDNTKGDCRITDRDGVLCFGYANAKKGDRIGDYRCVKEQGSGHTATFAIDNRNSLSPDKLDEIIAQNKARKAARALQIETAIKNELPAIERDKGYRQLLDKPQLKLAECDRLGLIERGLTDEQIEALQFRSSPGIVDGNWPVIPGYYSTKLSGFVKYRENKVTLNTPVPCVILPVKQNGLIVACELRIRNPEPTGGRYKVLTSRTRKNPDGVQPHIYGEMPLPVLPAPSGKSDGIHVIEGKGMKPAIVNIKHGVAVLGGARYWRSSENHSDEFLPQFREKYGDRVVLYTDAGDIHNKGILESWMKEYQFFTERGFNVEFAWWNQVNKTDCDIDELEDYSVITFLSGREFLDLVDLHTEGREKARIEALEAKLWEWYKTTQAYTPDIVQNSRYVEFPDNLPESGVNLIYKAPMGTGKTEATSKLVRKRANNGKKALFEGAINNLLGQISERMSSLGLSTAHIKGDQKPDNYKEASVGFVCVHSAHKYESEFGLRNIYMDEITSVIGSVIAGDTFTESEQDKAFKMIKRSLNLSDFNLFLDARLTDRHAKLISTIDPGKKVIKIENTTKVSPKNIKFVDAFNEDDLIKKRDKSPLIAIAMGEEKKRFIVTTDCKNFAKNFNKVLEDSGKKGYSLHSETSNEPWAQEFTSNPDKFIEREQPDYIIISPSGGTGLSITVRDYFAVHLTILYGVLPPAGALQMTGRLRDTNVPHYIYCPERGIRKDQKRHYYHAARIKATQDTCTLSAELLYAISEDGETAASYLTKRSNKIIKDDPFFDFAAESLVIQEYEIDHLRKCLIWMLEEEGHNVEVIKEASATEWNDKLSEANDELQKTEAHAIFESPVLELDDAKRLAKGCPNKQTRKAITKALLTQERLPGIEAYESWSVDFILKHIKDNRWISNTQRYAQLQEFEAISKKYERDMFYKATGEYSFINPTRPHRFLKLWAAHEMDVLGMITKLQNNELHKDSPEIVEFDKKFRENKKLQTAWGVDPYKQREDAKERIDFLRAVLSFVGVALKSSGKKVNKDGIRLTHYQLDMDKFNDPMRLAIVEITQKHLQQYLLSDAPKKINWNAHINVDIEANNLCTNLQKAATGEEIELFENEWKSRTQSTWEGQDYLTEEMYEHNKKIEQILKQAWERLPQDELARLKALRTSEMPKAPMAEVITYQAVKAQEVARQLDTKEGHRNQKRLEKQQQADNLIAATANLCEKAEDAVRAIKAFVSPTHLGEFLHHIGGVLRREILDTDKFFHLQYRKMMKSEVDRFMSPELFLQLED